MTEETWTAVDRFFGDLLVTADPALDEALAASAAAGLPAINVSPVQGKLLHLLARAIGARNVLEIGTLGGYSTIWLARALPDGGRVISLEADPRHAEVARANIARAGLEDSSRGAAGDGAGYAARAGRRAGEPFDFVFIDADKPNNAAYFDWALRLSRPGSIIVVDNVVRGGDVIDAASDSPTRARRASLPGTARRRAAGQRHRDPDGRRQGLRRFRDRARDVHFVAASGLVRRGGLAPPASPLIYSPCRSQNREIPDKPASRGSERSTSVGNGRWQPGRTAR